MQLFEVLMDRLDVARMELFLIQAWTMWNQRNVLEHGGQMKDPHMGGATLKGGGAMAPPKF